MILGYRGNLTEFIRSLSGRSRCQILDRTVSMSTVTPGEFLFYTESALVKNRHITNLRGIFLVLFSPFSCSLLYCQPLLVLASKNMLFPILLSSQSPHLSPSVLIFFLLP